MPGAIIHIIIGLISAFLVHKYTKKFEFSLAIFIGNLLPDAIKIIALMFYHNTINIYTVITSEYNLFAHSIVNGADFIILLFLFLLSIGLVFRHYHFFKPKKMCEYDEWVFFLLIGYTTHIILDLLEPLIYNYLGIASIPIFF
jgi:cbb3-type cytochrome oxidase subunit 3